jgi:hypothetical protein
MFNNQTDITDALQAQIDQLSISGGGSIVIGPGLYHIRQIALKSNINLHLTAGARLLASGDKADYQPIGYDHNEMGNVYSIIYAMGQENVSISGQGIIDLNGDAFYHKENPNDLPTVGPTVTQEYLDEAPRTYDWRINQPIFFHECTHVRVEDVQIRNASCWTITCNFCHSIKMLNLTIENSLIIPNSDGIHFCGSTDIIISGCHITAGDDCIAFTSITDWNRATENVTVSDCVFQSGSKAISIGYMHSIVRNIVIENIIVKKSNRAYVTMCHPRTGLVENIRITNCILEGRSYGGNWWGNGEPMVIMATPHHISRYREPQPADRFDYSIRNLDISGIICRAERPIAVVASEPDLCSNIRISDSTIEIVPEEKPSLMGNVIDLSPGEEHFQIPSNDIGVVTRNATVAVNNVTDADGKPVNVINE